MVGEAKAPELTDLERAISMLETASRLLEEDYPVLALTQGQAVDLAGRHGSSGASD